MKKNLFLSGQFVSLRLADKGDIDFLYNLRQQSNTQNTVHGIASFDSHQSWFFNYLLKDDDYLFIAEINGSKSPCGTVAITDIDFSNKTAEVGRWLMLPSAKHGPEALLLAYAISFEHLGIHQINTRVMARNAGVVKFHQRMGMLQLQPNSTELIDGKAEEMVYFQLPIEKWPHVQKNISAIIQLIYG